MLSSVNFTDLICCLRSVFMIVAPSCSAVLLGTAEKFSSNNLSQIDARVIQLSSPMKKTHMKEILYVAVIVGQQAAWSGWGDYCIWAFVSCGEVSSSAHPIIKKQTFFIIPFLCHMFSLPSSLMGVMLKFTASPLLVCDAYCGFSVGAFTSVPWQRWSHRTNVSSSEQLGRLMGQERRLLLIGGKCAAHGVCLSGAGEVV